MDIYAPRRPRVATYLVVCAAAMAFGWGLARTADDGLGAALPGVLGGLSIALVSPDDHKRNRVAALAVAGGLGISIGAPLARAAASADWYISEQPWTIALKLAVEGAVLGGIAGLALALALSPVRYRPREVLALVALGLLYFITLVSAKPRLGNLPGVVIPLTLVLLLFWVRAFKRDRVAFLVVLTSVVGFGLGAVLGHGLAGRAGAPTGPVAGPDATAIVMGLCAGASWGLVAFVLDEDLVRPRLVSWNLPTWGGFVYIVGWTPVAIGDELITDWAHASQAALPLDIWMYRAAVVACLLVCVVLLAARPPKRSPLDLTALSLLWVATSCGALKLLEAYTVLPRPHGLSGVHVTLGILWLGVASYATIRWRRLVKGL